MTQIYHLIMSETIYKSFVIIGCPTSIDINIVCIIENSDMYSIPELEIDRLKSELVELGYNLERKLDIRIVVIENNAVSNDTNETTNTIISTYQYHRQKYPMPDLIWQSVDIIDKCQRIANFLLDNDSDLLSTDDPTNIMKSLVMLYVQLILLDDNIYEYTKQGLIDRIALMVPVGTISQNVEWFLFRGQRGTFSDQLIPWLHFRYMQILTTYQ